LGFLSSLNINRELVSDIREVIQYFAESYSSGYTVNFGDSLKLFFKETNAISITEDALLHFKGKYSLKKDEPKIALIRTFVRQMRYMQLDSQVEEGVFELFDKWRLSGGDRGVPVLSLDPISGPFSDIEFEAIGSQAAAMYAEGTITLVQYALILLFKATGRRPEQIASLKILDFVFTRKHTKSEVYAINIPRIKQNNSVFRGSFKMFGLIDSTGQVLTEYLKQHIKHVQAATGRQLTKAQIANLPLFTNEVGLETLKDAPNKGLISLMHTEVLHMTSINIGKRLKKAVGELQVTSERTGEVIHVNAYRFRYTVGTRAAREGAGELTIANVLDHSDTNTQGFMSKMFPNLPLIFQ
jgi:integrase